MPWRNHLADAIQMTQAAYHHVSHQADLVIRAVGTAAVSYGSYLLAEGPAVLEKPTPVIVAVCLGVASMFAPGIINVVAPSVIKEVSDYFRRRQARQAEKEDREFQRQIDENKADAARLRKHVDTLKGQVGTLEEAGAAADLRARTALEAAAVAHRKAEDAEKVIASARVRLRNLERRGVAARVDIDSNTAGIGVAEGKADAALQALQSGDGIPALPPGDPVPETNWPLVLLCEDSKDTVRAMTAILEGRAYRVEHAATVVEGIVKLGLRPSFLWVDLRLAGGSGEEVIRRAKENGLKARIFVYTGHADEETEERLMAMGVERVVLKTKVDRDEALALMQQPPPGAGAGA